MPRTPVASVIIPVLDRMDHLVPCLRALATLQTPAHEVIVVANGTPDAVLDDLPDPGTLLVLRSPVNLGFGGGCNWGARVARGRHLVLLNDDTEVEPGWLDALVRVAESDSRIGAVGSTLLDPDGTLQEAGSVLWRDAGTHQVGRGLPPGASPYRSVRDVDYCSGCGLLVKREAWDAVGGFDESYYPAYFEDVDLCMSMRSRGYRVVYAPDARLRHLGGGSMPADRRSVVAVRNGRRFLAKWRDALVDFDPRPTGRHPEAAIEAAVERAERRQLPELRSPPSETPVPRPVTELEALRVQARALQAALALDDDLVLQLRTENAKLERLRRTAWRVPLGRQLLGWVSRRLEERPRR